MEPLIVRASFLVSVYDLSQLPPADRPELAFAGRSNVGKSSLLNRLLGRRNLAKVGARPGVTQALNFFLINDAFYLVDLPGYGFSKAPQHVSRHWHGLVERYLQTRKNLKGVVCIFDIRRLPDRLDLDLLDYLQALNHRIWIVLNKVDKIPQPRRAAQIKTILRHLPGSASTPVVFSARTGEGRETLLNQFWSALTT